jgi:putative tryptophan/tyrosine transport system substrate-binding protein
MRRREFIAGLGGAAAAWPLGVHAQQLAMPVIGYLGASTENAFKRYTESFRQGLREQGFVEGRNVEIIYRWAENQFDRLPGMANDLVQHHVRVIAAVGGAASAPAAKSATATVPIVFANGADPLDLGLVASLNRPGGNVTGITFITQALTGKRVEVLHEIVPAAMSIGYLGNPTNPQAAAEARDTENAARFLGVRSAIFNVSTVGDIRAAFTIIDEQQIGALVVGSDPLLFGQGAQIVQLANRHQLPAIFAFREEAEVGGLVSLGASISEAYRLYAGRVLKGERPADLPVVLPTKFELVINMPTARALGLAIPEILLATADEVIQ